MSNLYRTTTYTLNVLVDQIEQGRVGLPEIQRPFVWGSAKARDLIESMYRGYPVGTLLFWDTGADSSLRQIDNVSSSVARLAIVDGQQRLTSLYAVLRGKPVLTKNFKREHIRIAFNPVKEKFEVANPAIRQNPEYVPDISAVFDSYRQTVRDYLARLESNRGIDLTQEQKDVYEDRIDRVRDLQKSSFQAIEINEQVEAYEVAEIFVRTNSKGITLNQTDFILTLMSVYWDKGRYQLEEFCRHAKKPVDRQPSPHNPFIDPSPDQMLRVSVGLAFRRGRLATVYNILRGKDLDTGEVSAEHRDSQFERLKHAQDEVLNLTNWQSYLKCLYQAGFRNHRMITSQSTVLYTYLLWLIGRVDLGLAPVALQSAIARWFFMAQITGRYTSSPETRLEADLARISLAGSDGQRFLDELDAMINVELTPDFWEINLPNRLDTSSARSPALVGYWATLVVLEAKSLLGNQRVQEIIDEGASARKAMKRHRLFSRPFLKTLGITSHKEVNAIGNMVFADWPAGVLTGSRSPADYWPEMIANIPVEWLSSQIHHHALPIGWEQLDYSTLLEKRRRLMAQVTREGFVQIGQEARPVSASLQQLLEDGESQVLEFKSSGRYNILAGMADKKMEQVIVKTVCGFLNADGGKLLIGVDDQGQVVGLDMDYSTFRNGGNADRYELWLRQRLDQDLSITTAKVVNISFEESSTGVVCVIGVSSSGKPVFARPVDGNLPVSDFWVRVGNATKQLYGYDQHEYIRDHWG